MSVSRRKPECASTKFLTIIPARPFCFGLYNWCTFTCPHPGLTFVCIEDTIIMVNKNQIVFVSASGKGAAALSSLQGGGGRCVLI